MEIETFLLCDAATDQMGKLNILGAFDTINAAKTPALWPHCAVALRVRFARIEEGGHKVRIGFMDEDGKAVLPPLEGNVDVKFRPGVQTVAVNLILNINRLKLERAGEYSIDLAVDGRQEKSLPLYVRLRKPPPRPAGKGENGNQLSEDGKR